VNESRKRVIGIIAVILCSPKLAQYDGGNSGSCNRERHRRCDSVGRGNLATD
jgi:hypothetical protein